MTSSPRMQLTIIVIALCLARAASGDIYEVTFPPSTNAKDLTIGVTHTLWVPNDAKTIRGIIVHQHGCGVGACKGGQTAAHDLHWQALARKWDCALLGPSYDQAADQNCRLWCDPRNGSNAVFVKALEALAKKSGHPEVAKVPWCLWGHSGGGFWASLMQMEFPDRIMAIWFQSGTAHSRWVSGEIEAPRIPVAAMTIPMMASPGLKERDHERFQTAWNGSLEMFRDYRSRGAPIAFTPDPKSGHETRDSRYLAIPFFDACLEQRLPSVPGAAGPLPPMDQRRAWLATVPLDFNAPHAPPVPIAKFSDDPRKAVWLPNERVAKAWSDFVQYGEVADTTPPSPPSRVETTITDKGVKLSWQAEADFESGIAAFEIRRNGSLIGTVPESPATRFGRPLFQKMSYHDTPERPLSSMEFLDEHSDGTSEYTVHTINSVGLRSAASAVNVFRELEYASVADVSLKLDLYLPEGRERTPLVVWIHGGGWRAGSKTNPPLKRLTEQGFALASISYRFADKAVFPAQIHDCKAAIRWLRANAPRFGYDPNWIAVAGGSAGGHLALLVGVSAGVESLEGDLGSHRSESSRVQAIIDYYGPSDFVLRGKTQPDRAYTNKSGSFALLGGRDGKIPDPMESFASPAHYVSKDDPPLLIFHGEDDRVVLLDQSERMVSLYNSMRLDVDLKMLAGAGHGGSRFFNGDPFETLIAFLRNLAPSHR